MKGMIFAAGLGTRLKPFTLSHPKALVPLCGTPMLERVILKMKESGINDITVNVHHFSGQITEFLKSHDNFGVEIHISDESGQLLDTGGGVLYASRFLAGSEPVLVHNADIFTDFDLGEMSRQHAATGSDATLLAEFRETSRYLFFNDERRLEGWGNICSGETRPEGFDMHAAGLHPLAFGGVHIINPSSILKALEEYGSAGEVFGIIPFYVSNCHRLNIQSFSPAGEHRWFDIGKPENITRAEAELARQAANPEQR
ncbi:MAG: sugar phosphate nucleotidyltransferase [Muribaculaceae bacterium]|nr:sugar phosphate nucleotidyltransferase [Muribaculaceae bacterium]